MASLVYNIIKLTPNMLVFNKTLMFLNKTYYKHNLHF
jgi:hypothetical protein